MGANLLHNDFPTGPLICTISGCTSGPYKTLLGLRYTVSSIITLTTNVRRQHTDLHTRPFDCNLCSVRSFGDKGGLNRHRREFHGQDPEGRPIEYYPCPHNQCRRHKRGFARKWNLTQHLRRCPHGDSGQASVAASDSDSSQSPPADSPLDSSIFRDESSPRIVSQSEESLQSLCQGLQDKVTEWKVERARLDEERKRLDEEVEKLDGKISAVSKAIDEL